MSNNTAALSSIGYMYQIRYGLLLLLKSKSDSQFYIEKFDDVSISNNDGIRTAVQLKHKQKPITDSSPDLWKTIGNWMNLFEQNLISKNTLLTIVTTSKSSKNSCAEKLSPDEQIRDVEDTLNILNKISSNHEKKKLGEIYKKFFYFDEEDKRFLLSRVYVLDSSSSIIDVKKDILHELKRATNPEHYNSFFERLEGWWFDKVLQKLLGLEDDPISNSELEAKVGDLREQFFSENLPIDFEDLIIDSENEDAAKNRMFVKQLELISLNESYIKKAISDYYKAYSQRSRWIREKLVFFDELESYENKLKDEWERKFYQMKDYPYVKSSESTKKLEGKKMFFWMDSTADFCIRKNCLAPYVMRGSYHMLADRLEVGWHPDFSQRLKYLVSTLETEE